MKAIDITTKGITPLKTSDKGDYAIRMMEECKVSHLPIVNNEDFLGLISEADILSENNIQLAIGAYTLSLNRVSVFESQHIYDVFKIFSESKLTVLPVLNGKNHYLGVITLADLCHSISQLTAVSNPGAVVVLEMFAHDYILSQIANIVESNDAKILSVYIHSNIDSTKMEVILKINKNDISSIIPTFNRFNYIVKESFSESEYFDMLNTKYDEFMTWLNI